MRYLTVKVIVIISTTRQNPRQYDNFLIATTTMYSSAWLGRHEQPECLLRPNSFPACQKGTHYYFVTELDRAVSPTQQDHHTLPQANVC